VVSEKQIEKRDGRESEKLFGIKCHLNTYKQNAKIY